MRDQWKVIILGSICIAAGILIGRLITPVERVEIHGVPVQIVSLEGVSDNRPGKDNVDAMVVLDKQVPNGYGLLVVDLKHGGSIKLKLTNTQGQGIKWGSMVNRLHTQFSPKVIGLEPNELTGLTARFYSSDFPPEVLKGKTDGE